MKRKREEKKKGKTFFFFDFRHNENAWFGFWGSEDFHHWLLFSKYRNFRVADSCFDGWRFSFQETSRPSAKTCYDSCAAAENVICANKNAFSREYLLANDDLIHTIIKFGNMSGSNDNNPSDRLNSIHSKVGHVGDALHVLHVWMLLKTNGGKIY